MKKDRARQAYCSAGPYPEACFKMAAPKIAARASFPAPVFSVKE